jgi:hypothetical protein
MERKRPPQDAPDEVPGESEIVPLNIGQRVKVRSKLDGKLVATGDVTKVIPATGVVVVRDMKSGTDLQISVNADQYEIWIQDEEVVGNSRYGKPLSVYLRPSLPGPYAHRTVDV